jgi:membrane-associated phospholipid phosphatase
MSFPSRGVVCGICTVVCITTPTVAVAQAPTDPIVNDRSSAAITAPETVDEPGVVRRFVRDVAGDYVHFVSPTNVLWLGIGGGAALALHPVDDVVQERATQPDAITLPGGTLYGSQKVQVPAALVWWIVGHAVGSERGADAGRDLLRAQISVASWTYAIKFAVGRTRPNGDPHSFPSGHASTSFATAMVLQEHYGWKLGVPAFAAAIYTGASRISDNQHWLTDVAFGAVVGMVSGRTATLHLHGTRVAIAPIVGPDVVAIVISPRRSSR